MFPSPGQSKKAGILVARDNWFSKADKTVPVSQAQLILLANSFFVDPLHSLGFAWANGVNCLRGDPGADKSAAALTTTANMHTGRVQSIVMDGSSFVKAPSASNPSCASAAVAGDDRGGLQGGHFEAVGRTLCERWIEVCATLQRPSSRGRR